MNWSDLAGVVGKAAPVLGTVLGGPAGAAVGGLVAAALGTAATPDAVSAAVAADPQATVKLREIETTHKERFQALVLEQTRVELADAASARGMQVQTRSPIPALLSIGVTLGYFGILVGMLTGWLRVTDSQVLLIMLGSLSTAWSMVLSFWFGTTRQSEQKTALLAQSTSR